MRGTAVAVAFIHIPISMSAKSILFRGLYSLSPLLSQHLLFRLTGRHRFWPFYHVVSAESLPHIKHLYCYPDPTTFEQQLDELLRYFKPVDLATALRQPNPEQPILHLSFDDGLRECATVIAPILKRKGIPATFFLNSAFVDNRALMFRYKASLLIERGQAYWQAADWQQTFANYGLAPQSDLSSSLLQIRWKEQELLDTLAAALGVDFSDFLQKQRPYLSLAELKTLQADGFTLGAHSHDHPRYNSLSLEEQLGQTQRSIAFLKNNLQIEQPPFAFPFTDDGLSLAFFEALANEGISCFGGAGIKQDEARNNLQRFPMEQKKHIRPATQLLKAEYAYYALRRLFAKHRIRR